MGPLQPAPHNTPAHQPFQPHTTALRKERGPKGRPGRLIAVKQGEPMLPGSCCAHGRCTEQAWVRGTVCGDLTKFRTNQCLDNTSPGSKRQLCGWGKSKTCPAAHCLGLLILLMLARGEGRSSDRVSQALPSSMLCSIEIFCSHF